MVWNKFSIIVNLKSHLSFFKICSFLYLIIFFSSSLLSANSGFTKFNATATKIIDGDTFEIVNLGKRKTIRLWGIDTPEWDQPYSGKAKKFLQETLLQHQLSIQPLYHDKFGRLIATVYLDEVNINELLIEKGLAWVHIYYCNKDICHYWRKLEKIARSKRLGLWQHPHPVPPWLWKRKN